MTKYDATFLDKMNEAFDTTAANRAERLGTVPDEREMKITASRFALGVTTDLMSNFLSAVSSLSPTDEIHPDLKLTVSRIEEAWNPILNMDLPSDDKFVDIVETLLKKLARPSHEECRLQRGVVTSTLWSEVTLNFKQVYKFFRTRVRE